MIIAYEVSYQETETERYVFPKLHLFLNAAINHVNHLVSIQADMPEYKPVLVNSVIDQQVLVTGNVAGYQFSRTRMGKRTIRRKVTNLNQGFLNIIVGEITFKGRRLEVNLANHLHSWEATRII